MKKFLGILVLGLLFCNVGFAASDAEYIKRCAEHKYGKKLNFSEFQKIMTPENVDEGHEFIDYFAECEEAFRKHPITFKELFD